MKNSLTIISLFCLLTSCFLFACKNECITTGNCNLTPDPGTCKASLPRYYFDKKERKCKEFIWGGCFGVVPFETMEACSACGCE